MQGIEKVLKKNLSTKNFTIGHGESIIGGKDYQGRVRNILMEQRRKLEGSVKDIDS